MKRVGYALFALSVLAALPAMAAPAAPAVERLKQIQSALVRDKAAGDWRTFLADAKALNQFLGGAPRSTLEMARAEMQLADTRAALRVAKRFLAMGQTHPILATPLFEPIAKDLEAGERRNEAPVSLGQVAFRLPDPGLVAEDLDYDRTSGRFFVTSILEHKIVTVTPDGAMQTFAAGPEGWPMLALKVDPVRRRLWATEVAFAGFVVEADAGRSMILEYDLDTARLLQRIEGPAHSGLGDLALAPDGDPIIADGDGGGLYRVHEGRLSRIDHGDFVSPQTPAVCPDGRVFVPDYVRGVAVFDPATGAVRWLASSGRYALTGIDGLYCRGHELLATQNGASPERVVAFRLNAAMSAVVGQSVIDRTPLTDPTHGAIVGNRFYYIGNSGWAALDDHGAVKPGSSLTAAVLMKIERRQ